MRAAVERQSEETEKIVRDSRRATRRQYSAEEKVRIVIAGLRGEESIAELCRKEGINQNLYYRWSKEFFRVLRSSDADPLVAVRGLHRQLQAVENRGRRWCALARAT